MLRCLMATAVVLVHSAVHAGEPEFDRGLAAQLIRTAVSRTMVEPLTVEAMEAAIIIAKEALALDPDNLELWRITLDLALVAEDEGLTAQAIERLCKLDPSDEFVRLLRLNSAVDRYQTVEQRVVAYESLLAEQNLPKLGPSVASRLAHDLALLYQRQGDLDRFSSRLSQSIALDSSNRAAAAMAAGFFRLNAEDAFGEAELLVNLMIADPTDMVTQVALGKLLLEHGAYTASERLYQLAVNTSLAGRNMPTNDLLADHAIAQWASGQHDAALETIRRRQAELNQIFRDQHKAKNPNLSMLELSGLTAPMDPALASVMAVILSDRDAKQGEGAVEAALTAYQTALDALKKMPEPPAPAALAAVQLEMALVGVWLGADVEQVGSLVAAADELQPLNQEAKDRFAGWIAYRKGELEQAVELLRPLAAQDAAARIGLGLALQAQGKTKEAAREFLAASTAQPGSLLGIWASNRLTAILGRRVPMSDVASRLEELIQSIPIPFFRYVLDSSLALSVRVFPVKTTFEPFEPIPFDVEITNNSMFPLGIDRDGPLRAQLIVAPSVRSADVPGIGDLRPFVVNIQQRLRLMPRERLTVRVDLRNHHPADVIDLLMMNGSIVKLTVLVNFGVLSHGVIVPAVYGVEVDAPLMRVEGAKVTDEWIRESMEMMSEPSRPETLRRMALLSRKVAPLLPRDIADDQRELITAARTVLEQAYARLDGDAQAWLLSMMPSGFGPPVDGLQGVLALARKSDHRLVRLCYLAYHSTGLNDPMLDAAIRGDDPVIRRVGELLRMESQRLADQPATTPAEP